jgi:predicted nucleic-acid-binding protein
VIGIDTNVLIRYLVQDESFQARKATALIERRLSEANPGFLSTVVMAEAAWVLERSYGLGNEQIANIFERILQSAVFVVERDEEVSLATSMLKEGAGSFPDALIGALATSAGCSKTLTFDRRALRIPGFAAV